MMTPRLHHVAAAVAALSLSGCAQFSTIQTDTSQTGSNETRTITTRASARTFAASKTALQGWRASQTDGEQGASVGALKQESDIEPLMSALGRLAIRAFQAYASGGATELLGASAAQASPASAVPPKPVVPPGWKLVPVDDPSGTHYVPELPPEEAP